MSSGTTDQIAQVKKRIAELDKLNQEILAPDDSDIENLRQKLMARKDKKKVSST